MFAASILVCIIAPKTVAEALLSSIEDSRSPSPAQPVAHLENVCTSDAFYNPEIPDPAHALKKRWMTTLASDFKVELNGVVVFYPS